MLKHLKSAIVGLIELESFANRGDLCNAWEILETSLDVIWVNNRHHDAVDRALCPCLDECDTKSIFSSVILSVKSDTH